MATARKSFYVWLVPFIWVTCSLVHFQFPGDEYGMYAISSVVGIWIAFFLGGVDIHSPVFPLSIALAGAPIMAAFGFAMDRAVIRRVVWGALFGLSATTIFFVSLTSYPTLERALRKNGSLFAYVFFSINLGLYLSILLSLLGKGVARVYRKIRNTTPVADTATADGGR